MEQIFMYRTSGGKDLLNNLSNEAKPIILTVLEGMQKDGIERTHWGLTIENNRKDNNLHIK